jgi:hypothetical protein
MLRRRGTERHTETYTSRHIGTDTNTRKTQIQAEKQIQPQTETQKDTGHRRKIGVFLITLSASASFQILASTLEMEAHRGQVECWMSECGMDDEQ